MTQRTYGKLLGELIRQKRKAKGLTQLQLAEDAFGSGSKTRRISELETGLVANPYPTTIDPIIAVLSITEEELEICAKAAFTSQPDDLTLAYREVRNLLDRVAYQFEHAHPEASILELDEFLRSKVKEWRALKARVDEIDNSNSAISKMKTDVSIALTQGKFKEVDEILEKIENIYKTKKIITEVEKLSQIRIIRGDSFLLNEQNDRALESYIEAAKFFEPFDKQKMADTLDNLSHQIYESGLRSIKPRFFIASSLLEALLRVDVIANDEKAFAKANYQFGLVLRNQARRVNGDEKIVLLDKAIEHAKLSKNSSTPVPTFQIVCSHLCHANALMDKGKAVPDVNSLSDAIDIFRVSKTLAAKDPDSYELLGFVCSSLAAALVSRGSLTSSNDISFLNEALDEVNAAIEASEKSHVLETWGGSKALKAKIQFAKAGDKSLPENDIHSLMVQAIANYLAALETYPVTAFPDRFGEVQFEIGGVFYHFAMWLSNELTEYYMMRAIHAYESATQVISEEVEPSRWATIQMYIGTIFARHGALPNVHSQEHDFTEAITRYQLALTVLKNLGLSDAHDHCQKAISQAEGELAAWREQQQAE